MTTRLAGMGRACGWLAMILAVPALAQVTATSEYLARMDVDGDGRVSPVEYLDWMGYAFDARDLNRDAVLTADELPGGKGQPLTREQHRERLSATFRKQDTNRDGFLNARELAAPPQ
jgi:Ca2+-binding EF-hand superfamily protein